MDGKRIYYSREAAKLIINKVIEGGNKRQVTYGELLDLFSKYCEENKIACNMRGAVSSAANRLILTKRFRRVDAGVFNIIRD